MLPYYYIFTEFAMYWVQLKLSYDIYGTMITLILKCNENNRIIVKIFIFQLKTS